jgi:hypothetical protein
MKIIIINYSCKDLLYLIDIILQESNYCTFNYINNIITGYLYSLILNTNYIILGSLLLTYKILSYNIEED